MTDQQTITFHDGNSIPQLGFGIWQIPQDETAVAVRSAIETGYRLIDGAYVYGNEAGLGRPQELRCAAPGDLRYHQGVERRSWPGQGAGLCRAEPEEHRRRPA